MTNKSEFEYKESSFREKMLEHVFLSELLQYAWRQEQTIDVLRSEVDNSGHDLVLDWRGVRRYIQLKSSKSNTKKRTQIVNAKLADKPGGCVIWLFYEDDGERVSLEYRFFGGSPIELPDLGCKRGKHTKRNAQEVKTERENTRKISRSKFTKFSGIGELINTLLGMPKPNLGN